MSENEKTGGPPEEKVASDSAGAAGPGPAAPGAPPAGGGGGSRGGMKALLAVGITVLAIVVVAASFGLGYAIGNKDTGAPALRRAALRQGLGDGAGGGLPGDGQQGAEVRGRLREMGGRLREMVESGEASVVRGSVASVQDGTVTVETESGQQTVDLTEQTRYLSAGGGDAGGGSGALEAGRQVQVLARKGPDGKLQAIAVRTGAARMNRIPQGQESR